MKKLVCLFVVLLFGAAPPTEQQITVHVSSSKFSPYTFKSGYKGFVVEYSITKNDFPGKIFPGRQFPRGLKLFFNGPQPIRVNVTDSQGKDLTLVPSYLGLQLYKHRNNTDLKVKAYYKDPVDKYKNQWKQFQIKVIGEHEDPVTANYIAFSDAVMDINGVVGHETETITLAKDHPKLKEIRREVEALAKKHKIKITEWLEKDGYDYMWKK